MEIATNNNLSEKKINGIDEIIVQCYFDTHSCPGIFLVIVITLFIFFPPILFAVVIGITTTRVIDIDEDKDKLIIYNNNLYGCCNCCKNEKTYSLKNIKKIRIYATWIPDPNVGFGKIYYMNAEIFSLDGESENLFSNLKYDKDKYEEYESFFTRHLNTEVEPLELAKRSQKRNRSLKNEGNIGEEYDLNEPGESDDQNIIDEYPAKPMTP